ncbi:MAG: phosphate acyltransferase PlsX [Alphaproteobacteria bacterium]|nr:phosphate acyltransferase PlsX [Alphaproteobacteria bacterium]
MPDRLVVALDAMGGDRAPEMIVGGAELARERYPEISFLMVGDKAQLEDLLAGIPALRDVTEVRHTTQVVRDEDKPSTAIRQAKESSMRRAIDAVADGEADCVVSAGNTGALMAVAKFVLKMHPGIARPAITTFFPTLKGESCMLDLGANLQCDANNLVEFAVMGEVFARTVLGIEQPTIGLLNIGVEELKGHEEIREAAAILRETTLPIEFKGFVEGDDIAGGAVDVVVTDGFTGNIALKTAEGVANLYTGFLKQAFRSSLFARLSYPMIRRALSKVRTRTDPRRYNGAMLLGLNGIVIKSHGGTDELGFANAIGVGVDMTRHGFISKIKDDFERLKADQQSLQKAAVS